MADLTALYLSGSGDDAKIMAEITYARQLADDLKATLDKCEGWTSLSGTLEDMICELHRIADSDEEYSFPTAEARRDSAIEDRHTTGADAFGVRRLTDYLTGRREM